MHVPRIPPRIATSAPVLTAAVPTAAGPQGASGPSAADIALDECVVESSKDLSYVAFLADGETFDIDCASDEADDSETPA